eukprot:TRINITY_DN5162_c0_g1_i1.p1 TRINITY_DN5162_c0_g1~~TRINITY_DN5162_c0_g1_i1.p1  ORF type:complete len:234 (+),score=23.52 TRINITY_DN5162_c0_g1_i1:15-716(+)
MSSLTTKVNHVVTPGETVGEVDKGGIRLGQGLIQYQNTVVATKAGVLRSKNDSFFVENNQKRYVPSVDDLVLGIITSRLTESWKVDIGCHEHATLSMYSFEGATKKNRADLPVGSLVYCRVKVASRDMEPELSCMSVKGKKEGFGPLEGGYMVKCDTCLARDCLAEDSTVLNALGASIPYEVAVGVNGRIWVKATTIENTILVANCILNSQHMSPEQTQSMVQSMVRQNKSKR